jgi:hypothetical protein
LQIQAIAMDMQVTLWEGDRDPFLNERTGNGSIQFVEAA